MSAEIMADRNGKVALGTGLDHRETSLDPGSPSSLFPTSCTPAHRRYVRQPVGKALSYQAALGGAAARESVEWCRSGLVLWNPGEEGLAVTALATFVVQAENRRGRARGFVVGLEGWRRALALGGAPRQSSWICGSSPAAGAATKVRL